MDNLRFIPFFLLLVTVPVSGEIYKWVDEQGNVHYGDKPVKDGQQVQVDDSPGGNAPRLTEAQREERRQRLLQAFEEDRKEKEKQKAKQEKQKVKMERKCLLARDRLKNYNRASSLYTLDKDGNRVTLSDEERRKSTTRLQSQIDKYCK